MHLIYIDDSRDEEMCVFSALAVPAAQWRSSFSVLKSFRRAIKAKDGIYIHKEIHAWKFVSGRGHIADGIVTKYRRSQIFREFIQVGATLPGVRLFNACFPAGDDLRAFERLLNRINRSLQAWRSHGMLLCDQGKEIEYTRLVRRMSVFNPIPSQYGSWSGRGDATKNIPIDRILEDPVFKNSEQSYFIQLVDCIAYALLRRERPVASKSKYGIDTAFGALSTILVREATRNDTEGILRP